MRFLVDLQGPATSASRVIGPTQAGLVALLALQSLAAPAAARPIVVLGAVAGGMSVLDPGTLQTESADSKDIWSYGVMKKPRADQGRLVSYIAMEYRVDCAKKHLTRIRIASYDVSGKIIDQTDDADQSVQPRRGAGSELIWRAACEPMFSDPQSTMDVDLDGFISEYRGH